MANIFFGFVGYLTLSRKDDITSFCKFLIFLVFAHVVAQRRLSSSSPSSSLSLETEGSEEQEQVVIARVLSTLQPAESQKSRQDDNQRSTATYRDPNQPPPS